MAFPKGAIFPYRSRYEGYIDKTLTCTICGCPLSYSDIGIGSHLRKHIRAGELLESNKLAVKAAILRGETNKNKDTNNEA